MDCECCCFTETDPGAQLVDPTYVVDAFEPIDMPEPNYVVGPLQPFDPIQPVEPATPIETTAPAESLVPTLPTVPTDPVTQGILNDMYFDAVNSQDAAMLNLTSSYSPEYTARYDSTTNSTDWYRDGDLSPSLPR